MMKIQNITINKYKAFQRSEDIKVGGKNVFIYGENGSGKSSVYYALKDFFQSSVEVINMANLRNLYLTDGQTDCAIEVEFDGNAKFTLNESTKTTNVVSITDCNRLKSFITYKNLMAVHNVKIKDKIDVFDLIVNGVLKHFKSQTLTNGIELKTLWDDVILESKKTVARGKGDFNQFRQKQYAVQSKADLLNNALNRLFLTGNPDYLGPEINQILSRLAPGLEIELLRNTVQIDTRGNISSWPKILLKVTNNGTSLENKQPHFTLNEAKLSAIGISIFLGAILRQAKFAGDLKVLFLDDILIGLDNENRLKLLELLQENEIEESKRLFKGFQMFITTYDRHWYEVAKVHLKDWKFLEFYKGDNGPVIIDNDKGDLERAEDYFDAYDFPAAANYLRKVIEQQLLEKLPEYYTVNEKVTGLIKPPNLETLIDRLRLYYEELELQPPIKLIDSLKKYKTILFNPMSHNDIKSPIYKNDLLDAFTVVDELKKINLPKINLLVEKNKIFKISLPVITYEAEFTLASNLYRIDNEGIVTTTSPKLELSFWKREGVDYAMDSDSPPQQYSQAERLRIVSRGPYNLTQILASLNRTFTDRGVANIVETDLKDAMICDGKTLTQWLV